MAQRRQVLAECMFCGCLPCECGFKRTKKVVDLSVVLQLEATPERTDENSDRITPVAEPPADVQGNVIPITRKADRVENRGLLSMATEAPLPKIASVRASVAEVSDDGKDLRSAVTMFFEAGLLDVQTIKDNRTIINASEVDIDGAIWRQEVKRFQNNQGGH